MIYIILQYRKEMQGVSGIELKGTTCCYYTEKAEAENKAKEFARNNPDFIYIVHALCKDI